MTFKYFLYDFGNLNQYLFWIINSNNFGKIFDFFMINLSHITHFKNMAVIYICVLLLYGYIKFRNKIFIPNNIYQIFFTHLMSAWMIAYIIIKLLKVFLEFPRPIYVFGIENINLLLPIRETSMLHSFPSGHIGFITIFALVSAKYINNRFYSQIMSLLIIIVGYCRIYVGHHFPADILYGIIISILSVFLGDKLKNYLLKLWQKIYNKMNFEKI